MKFASMGLELARATEAAALSAGRWMGFGKRDEPDNDAIEAMHRALNQVDMDGHIVVGEEEKLNRHSLLDTGQKVGTGKGPNLDIVVDPIDGRDLLALGLSGCNLGRRCSSSREHVGSSRRGRVHGQNCGEP